MPIIGVLAAGGLAPLAPTIGTATAGDSSATVTYTAPSWVGKGSGAVTYTATSSPGGFTGTGTSPITVSGLSNGTAYTFTVKATTSYGVTGPSSAASNSITPAAGGSWESIQTITSGSAFASADFTSIPTTYKHLQVRAIMGGNANATDTNYIMVQLNGLSSTYFLDRYGVQNNSAVSAIQTGQTEFAPALASYENSGAITYFYGALILDIYDYNNANKVPVAMSMAGGNLNSTVGYYNAAMEGVTMAGTTAAAVNRITVYSQVGNMKANSKVALYGMKG